MTQSRSVGIVTPTVSRAGGGIFPIVLSHARGLAEAGLDVSVYGLDCDPERLDRHLWHGLPLRTYPSSRSGYAPDLTKDLLRGEHDIVHQHGLWLYPSVAVSSWRTRTKRPVLISTHGMLEPWALSNSAFKKRLAGALFQRRNLRGAAIIHCSAAEVTGVRAYSPTSAIAVIPNGTELPDLSRPPEPPSDLFPDDRHILLFLGRLHPKKGIAELTRAWAMLKMANPNLAARWRLVVAGWDDGGHAAGLKSLARELGLSQREVLFHGPRFGKDKAALLTHADAFILPSYSEGFPMAVLEAWSYSLPVFMTQECNMPEGFAVDAAMEITTEPAELAQRLGDLMTMSENERRAMGAAGRRLVEDRFTWDRITADMHEVYNWVLGGGPPPSCVMTD